jgi:replication factor A1
MSTEQEAGPAANIKVQNLDLDSRQVNLTVKVVSKGETRQTVSRRDGTAHRVVDALVGDETGSVYMTLWDDNIDKISEGATVSVRNGYVSLFKGSMRLNVGRYGSIEPSTEIVGEVNTENNLSNKQYEERRRYPYFRPTYREESFSGRSRGRGGYRGRSRGGFGGRRRRY